MKWPTIVIFSVITYYVCLAICNIAFSDGDSSGDDLGFILIAILPVVAAIGYLTYVIKK
ncbi:MAG: hypothetical protein WC554_07140 [Clostridia bacterium]|jgi:hypothetical protein